MIKIGELKKRLDRFPDDMELEINIYPVYNNIVDINNSSVSLEVTGEDYNFPLYIFESEGIK